MLKMRRFQTTTALLLMLGMGAGALSPLVTPAPVVAQTQIQFTDVSSSHWASQFIISLAQRDIIAGFPDGTFRPDEPVTRAQYAAMVRKAFNITNIRSSTTFVDVSADFWARTAIDEAYRMGFLSGYPNNVFEPNQNIPRAQVLVSLANGLNYQATTIASANVYRDSGAIPSYATGSIAAATEQRLVVNYPDVQALRPNQTATRADVAAFIYQALASRNQVATVQSPYIVQVSQTTTAAQSSITSGTNISVTYPDGDKIVLLPDETLPVTLQVAEAVRDSQGQILIPRNSEIIGELRPVTVGAQQGTQFVAQTLVLESGRQVAMQAQSRVITTTETIRRGASIGEIFAGAVLGSGAAAAIGSVTGDDEIQTWEVLTGTVAGAIGGLVLGRERVEVISVNPDSDLTLTVSQSVALAQ
ncbi:S-layer homology domain-containing protein [Leptothoe spongobia]|uniref:S-layer homology domain-containing protein n=1 Tax=Leptothoe spongobia TAU-MAC 1115 TaxID=1967444 RepID=A0A947DF60_9CYAN|nr:S-layer homology domain-containing protein [Leptothoe spongobia]MBT9315751.1 S-layer homology domain-containing protein [Leptothoe spongobia TAU-MAC 1115]